MENTMNNLEEVIVEEVVENVAKGNFGTYVTGGVVGGVVVAGGALAYKKFIKPWREKRKAAKADKERVKEFHENFKKEDSEETIEE